MFQKRIKCKILTLTFIISIVLLSIVCATAQRNAFAENKKLTPEQQQMQMITPMFGQIMKATMEAQLEIIAKFETADKLASFTKNFNDALIEKGFSKDQAFKIVLSAGFPAFPGIQGRQ
jgi:hypothetical protein